MFDSVLDFGEFFYFCLFGCAGVAVVASFSALILFLFRHKFSRRFWCLQFWGDGQNRHNLLSSSLHLWQPQDTSGFGSTRSVWFDSYDEAFVEWCNANGMEEIPVCHNQENGN